MTTLSTSDIQSHGNSGFHEEQSCSYHNLNSLTTQQRCAQRPFDLFQNFAKGYNPVVGFVQEKSHGDPDQKFNGLETQQQETQKIFCSLQNYSTDIVAIGLEDNEQLKSRLRTTILDKLSLAGLLSEYMLLYNDMKARKFQLKANLGNIEKMTNVLAKRKPGIQIRKEREEAEPLQNYDTYSRELIQEMLRLKVDQSYEHLEFKPKYPSPEEIMKLRLDILAQLPVPEGLPFDDLKPLKIPANITLKQVLEDKAFDPFRKSLSNYCAFTELTTMWCPDQEEHGFYLTPLYKCETSSRSIIIHQWAEVDVKARMAQPTEFFYKRMGEWYYTGTYRSFRLPDLTPKEYEELSPETLDSLIKTTLSDRKNVTPQIVFETSQLYTAGALKIAVVGIQCIGYNEALNMLALQHVRNL